MVYSGQIDCGLEGDTGHSWCRLGTTSVNWKPSQESARRDMSYVHMRLKDSAQRVTCAQTIIILTTARSFHACLAQRSMRLTRLPNVV